MHPKVDEFLNGSEKWQEELELLRRIVLDCELNEEFKWGCPCYTFQNTNVVLIHAFKDYCALLFFKGALLGDPEQILIQQTANVQAGRQIRFKNLKEIIALEPVIKAYIFEVMEVEKAGLKVELKKDTELVFPEEFQSVLDKDAVLKSAFEALTPGRQRAYNLYFSEPKQSQTRASRVDKSVSRILIGKGLTDCICGLSRKMPACDGSHKLMK
jgi:uncharacterized protein YdeI (YjbR/CyaY-like superfamily)